MIKITNRQYRIRVDLIRPQINSNGYEGEDYVNILDMHLAHFNMYTLTNYLFSETGPSIDFPQIIEK